MALEQLICTNQRSARAHWVILQEFEDRNRNVEIFRRVFNIEPKFLLRPILNYTKHCQQSLSKCLNGNVMIYLSPCLLAASPLK